MRAPSAASLASLIPLCTVPHTITTRGTRAIVAKRETMRAAPLLASCSSLLGGVFFCIMGHGLTLRWLVKLSQDRNSDGNKSGTSYNVAPERRKTGPLAG